ACGKAEERRLMSVPTGHQLRSSKEAMQVFQLIAVEIGRIAAGRAVRPVTPNLVELDRRRREERRLRKVAEADTRRLWSNYLVGPDNGLRIDLMNATSAYSGLLELHAKRLPLSLGSTIADLGAGTGPFSRYLVESGVSGVTIDEVDFVLKALRARDDSTRTSNLALRQVVADFDGGGIPLKSESYDGVCACLVVSYLREPVEFLVEINRILKPGGILSISGLRPDADVSKLFVEGMDELRSGVILDRFGVEAENRLQHDASEFLNEAARVLDFEEQGLFTFWDDETFSRNLRAAGFRVLELSRAFGDPPQALVASAVKR
ncbi:MAG: class I SAM-dependent methyltransferase, partial [Acidimicrobiia bacterium]